MSRIRTVKPEFFTSDTVGELSIPARLLFIGLWCLADKEGRLKDKPKWIKIQIFPYDDVNVDEILRELGEARFILRYEAEGEVYLQIENFVKHQRPHPKEPESNIPPSESGTPANKRQAVKRNGKKLKQVVKRNGEPLKETSNPQGREGNGVWEGNGDGMLESSIPNTSTPALPSQTKSSRLCDDDYLATLQANTAYERLDVRRVYAKMVTWCGLHNKVPTQRRLVNWLNNEDQPMTASANGNKPAAGGGYR